MQNTVIAVPALSPDAAGAIVLWRMSGDTNFDTLKAKFEELGLDAKLLPEMPSPDKALTRAVRTCEDKRILVRPLPGRRGGYALIHESAREEMGADATFEYAMSLQARLNYPVGGVPELVISGPGAQSPVADGIRAAYRSGLERLTSSDTAGWLCEMVRHVKAVPLRDTGGVYFVPRQHLDEWRKIALALRAASASYASEIPALQSKEAVDTILDSLQREADQFLGNMEDELQAAAQTADGMGGRAIKTRLGKCEATVEKLSVYEELLGVKLTNVQQRLNMLQANLAAAALVAASKEDSE